MGLTFANTHRIGLLVHPENGLIIGTKPMATPITCLVPTIRTCPFNKSVCQEPNHPQGKFKRERENNVKSTFDNLHNMSGP
jgi:hypothetical protein